MSLYYHQGTALLKMERLYLLTWIMTGILLSLTSFTDSQSCPGNPPRIAAVNETDLPVQFLANLTYGSGLTWGIVLKQGSEPSNVELRNWILQEALIIHHDAGQDYLVLNQTLDLEYIYDRWAYKMFFLQLSLTCSASGSRAISYDFFLNIQPVNEFYPEFVGDPFVLYIPENTSVDTTVITLKNNATDRDVVNGDAGDIFSFSMVVSHPNSIVDGGTLFMMKHSINGSIVVKSTLDFESFPSGSPAFVVFNDHAQWTNQTTLTIHILDSDDLPPVFYYPGCTGGCIVGSYKAYINHTQTGVVTNISPANITARDGDTLGFSVSYAIRHDSSTLPFRDHFHINSSTGEFSIIKPLGVLNDPEILLTIEATEVSSKHLASTKPLLLKLLPENTKPSNTTPTPKTPKAGDDENNTVIIIVIVLAVVVVVVLVALVILTVLVRKFSKKAVHPKEKQPQDTGSEGSQDVLTKHDDIHSTGSGQLLASDAALAIISNGSLAPESTKLLRGGRKWRRRGSTSIPRSQNSGDDNTTDDRTSSNSRLFDSGTISSAGFQNDSRYGTPTFANGFAQTGEPDEERYVAFPAIHLPGLNQNKKGHRRSRKQKKLEQAQRIKEEEFDGTKSYPMNPDPEFFTEAKKTKVKLSTRRKPTVGLDPKFWLTVDNDFMD